MLYCFFFVYSFVVVVVAIVLGMFLLLISPIFNDIMAAAATAHHPAFNHHPTTIIQQLQVSDQFLNSPNIIPSQMRVVCAYDESWRKPNSCPCLTTRGAKSSSHTLVSGRSKSFKMICSNFNWNLWADKKFICSKKVWQSRWFLLIFYSGFSPWLAIYFHKYNCKDSREYQKGDAVLTGRPFLDLTIINRNLCPYSLLILFFLTFINRWRLEINMPCSWEIMN